MRYFTKSTLVAALAVVLAVPLVFGTGFAQGWGNGMMQGDRGQTLGMRGPGHMGSGHMGYGHMGRGHMWGNQTVIPEEHRLDSDQRGRLYDIRSDFLKRTADLRAELQSARIDYRSALNESDTKTSTLQSLQEKVSDLRSELANERLESREQMQKVLTKEQWGYYGNQNHLLMGAGSMHNSRGICPGFGSGYGGMMW